MVQSAVAISPAIAGIDYVRGIIPAMDVETIGGVEGLYVSWLKAVGAAGNDDSRIKPLTVQSYVGVGALGGAYCVNPDTGDIWLQVPSAKSEEMYKRCGRVLRCTRLDVQFTGCAQVSAREHIIAVATPRPYSGTGKRPKGRTAEPRLIAAERVTLYVGKRSRSGRMLRIYEYEAKHDAIEGLPDPVRYEVEYTGAYAHKLGMQWGGKLPSPDECVGLVAAEIEGMGLCSDIKLGGTKVSRPALGRTKSDIDVTMEWLERSVAPSVRRLMMSGVKRVDILRRLGLG